MLKSPKMLKVQIPTDLLLRPVNLHQDVFFLFCTSGAFLLLFLLVGFCEEV